METAKKIILVDDHVIIRNGLKELIQKLGNYHIIGEYDNGKTFVDALPLPDVPDLIILDITMPEMDGDDVLDMLNFKNISYPVLFLTLSQDEARLISLIRKGARGCLQKNCTAIVLSEALESVFRFGYYHNELMQTALSFQASSAKTIQEQIITRLTLREREFLRYICHEDEYTYDQIASHMGVQPRTIDGYREDIFRKFNIKSKVGLVLFIVRNKLYEYL